MRAMVLIFANAAEQKAFVEKVTPDLFPVETMGRSVKASAAAKLLTKRERKEATKRREAYKARVKRQKKADKANAKLGAAMGVGANEGSGDTFTEARLAC